MKHPLIAAVLLGLACASAPVLADQYEQRYNQVALRAEVQQSVTHDTLRVTFFAEEQNKEPSALAENITTRLNRGLEIAKQAPGVKVSSGSRSSQPAYDSDGENIVAGRERGEIALEGSDFAVLTELTGKLMGNLNLGSMQFSLSPVTRRATEDELMQEAIEAFKARADLATRGLGGSGYKVVHLNLNSQMSHPPALYRARTMAMSADKEMSAPSVESGQADVTVSADGTIEVLLR